MDKDYGIVVAAIIFVFIIRAISFIFCSRSIKAINAVCVVTWFIFFFATETGIYSYGEFGNRYGLFFIPIWIVSLIVTAENLISILISKKWAIKIHLPRYVFATVVITVAIYFVVGIFVRILPHWIKEENRGMVDCWYKVCANDDAADTIVYHWGAPGFAYYLYHNENYNSQIDNKIFYWPQLHQDYYEDYSKEQCVNLIMDYYDGKWPEKVYLAGSHYNADFYWMVEVFNENGYIEEKVFDGRGEDIYVFSLQN